MQKLQGRKTYIVAAVTVLYALVVVGWGGGEWHAAAELILAGLGLAGLRDGVAKVAK